MLFIISNMLNAIFMSLQSCFEETMRASVVLLFAFLAFAFVAAYAAVEVSDNISITSYIALNKYNLNAYIHNVTCLRRHQRGRLVAVKLKTCSVIVAISAW